MQDLIFLTSKQFFEDNPDSLGFSGQFAAMAGVSLHLNDVDTRLTLITALFDGKAKSRASRTVIATPYRNGLKLLVGRTYQLQGSIEKLDDGATTVLAVGNFKQNYQVSAADLIDLGPMIVGGIGSIVKAKLRWSHVKDNAFWDLVVFHGPPMNWMSPNTKFTSGSRVSLRGHLDSLGNTTGMMIVNVTTGMYCDL
ncbi:hypothetical protein MJO28_015337 [Puccinia striiformis f. sp. tritici]|uniref:Uncharacterized protein n=1 Tax=Puccinia striiformis f. sp. tritici TaxID=168172 RepID=A0ACC0DSM8_9BASI|nr:hypothetical protein MJO28_015337 [Puccinia striiformis f. sp. tritici]